jgi:general secretion pathway protein H
MEDKTTNDCGIQPEAACRRSRRHAQRGFTLVEMLVVLSIIGLVMSFVGPRVLNYLGQSKVKAAKIQIQNFTSALDLFYLDTGRYPSSSEGLVAVCVVAIVAILAAIAVPSVPHATTRPRLEAYAIETAALLKADRTAALRRRDQISAQVDAPARTIRSGSTGRIVQVSDDVSFKALLPLTCNGYPARSTISFFATGTSCGGTLMLSRLGAGYEIRVNWMTGGIEVVTRDTL